MNEDTSDWAPGMAHKKSKNGPYRIVQTDIVNGEKWYTVCVYSIEAIEWLHRQSKFYQWQLDRSWYDHVNQEFGVRFTVHEHLMTLLALSLKS